VAAPQSRSRSAPWRSRTILWLVSPETRLPAVDAKATTRSFCRDGEGPGEHILVGSDAGVVDRDQSDLWVRRLHTTTSWRRLVSPRTRFLARGEDHESAILGELTVDGESVSFGSVPAAVDQPGGARSRSSVSAMAGSADLGPFLLG